MPSLRPLRRKIVSIESTRKITVAMKMVSAAKLRKAVGSMESTKPYADGMRDLMSKLSNTPVSNNPYLGSGFGLQSHAGDGDNGVSDISSPALIVLFTSDRGLCGGFNMSAIKKAIALVGSLEGREVAIYAVGKQGFDHMRRKGYRVINKLGNYSQGFSYRDAMGIGDDVDKLFVSGEFGEVHLVHNRFISTASQKPATAVLLPLMPPSLPTDEEALDAKATVEDIFEFEPEAEIILGELIPRYISFTIYFTMLESLAGENGARMVAMDAASRNAKELLESTKVELNKARQSNITGELLDIINGVQALG